MSFACSSSLLIFPSIMTKVLRKSDLHSTSRKIGSDHLYGHNIACKCQICDCGKHHCPVPSHQDNHYDPDCLRSHYEESYPERHPERPKSYKPQPLLSTTGLRFEGQSTNKQDFPHWDSAKPASKIVPSREGQVVIAPDNQRYWGTENGSNFNNKGYAKVASMKPQYGRTSGDSAFSNPQARFEGSSTNKDDFKHHVGAQPAQAYSQKYQLHTNQPENRDFQTEAALKFTNSSAERQASYKPKPAPARSNVPFEGQSTNKSDFQPFTFAGCAVDSLPSEVIEDESGHLLYKQNPLDGTWRPHAIKQSNRVR
jgi:hypothetical protein